MKLGPLLNKNKTNANFSAENSLGIEGVAASMQDAVCPVINTVTPRAFYWAFLVWIYYDFYTKIGIKEKNYKNFVKYLRRQDFYFIAATILSENDTTNLVGIRNVTNYLAKGADPVLFNDKYYSVDYGGMNNYVAGCISRDLICTKDGDEVFSFPKLNSVSKELGESFERAIKNTRYYNEYRFSDDAVPRDVLVEYGQVINLNLKGFDEVKRILRHRLFDTDSRLSSCVKYIQYLYKEYSVDHLDVRACRQLFFDHETENGESITLPEELKSVSDAWEIVIGRMYFATGLGMIWKQMLELIEAPLNKDEWIYTAINDYVEESELDKPLNEVLPTCSYDFDTREELIDDSRLGYDPDNGIEHGIKIALSIYNWLKNKTDLGDEAVLLNYGNDNDSISLKFFESTVDEYLEKPLRELLVFVIDNWLIKQHYNTAFQKLFYNIDGFFYEVIDDKYYKLHDYGIGFPGNRMSQLFKVMRDLDMLNINGK